MSSMAASSGRAQIAPTESDNSSSTPIRLSSRRTQSFSSSLSLSSDSSSLGSLSFHDDSYPLFSPSTPLQVPGGIPFSWEKFPGIPKKQISKKDQCPSSLTLLPLPPAGGNIRPPPSNKKSNGSEISPNKKKFSTSESISRDPFFTALVKCSKDDHHHHRGHHQPQEDPIGDLWKGSGVAKSLSDRFGFVNLYASCKRIDTISESIIYLPRSRR